MRRPSSLYACGPGRRHRLAWPPAPPHAVAAPAERPGLLLADQPPLVPVLTARPPRRADQSRPGQVPTGLFHPTSATQLRLSPASSGRTIFWADVVVRGAVAELFLLRCLLLQVGSGDVPGHATPVHSSTPPRLAPPGDSLGSLRHLWLGTRTPEHEWRSWYTTRTHRSWQVHAHTHTPSATTLAPGAPSNRALWHYTNHFLTTSCPTAPRLSLDDVPTTRLHPRR